MGKAKVFTPITIGTMTLKNRIVMAPTIHEMCYQGHPTEAYIAISETYAKSGASMVCIGGATVDPGPAGEVFPNALSIADDEDIFGLQRLAEGIKARLGADVGVGITGIAGPGGGSPQKPVGTVAIAVVAPGSPARVRTFRFPGGRAQVKFQSSQSALDMVRRVLKGAEGC